MFYPLKFKPVYKDYIWGGRNLEKLGKDLPDGIVAESWEISCHPDGTSVISNGSFEGTPLPEFIKQYGKQVVGTSLPEKDLIKFPLLVKLIDANDKLSVQVHPDDEYSQVNENGELGKNEMWYIISAKQGAQLVFDVAPGVDREAFATAVQEGRLESCLKYIPVAAGDVINIPAGLMHAIGEGIVLAEIQQNSNTTYRVYDYDRMDKNGNTRPLHIEKALQVIDFASEGRKEKSTGLKIDLGDGSYKVHSIANHYFSVELYNVNGRVHEDADGSKFFIYVFTEGEGVIGCTGGETTVKAGESVLIPASMGRYTISGSFKALKSYVPDLELDVVSPLKNAGYTLADISNNVSGIKNNF